MSDDPKKECRPSLPATFATFYEARNLRVIFRLGIMQTLIAISTITMGILLAVMHEPPGSVAQGIWGGCLFLLSGLSGLLIQIDTSFKYYTIRLNLVLNLMAIIISIFLFGLSVNYIDYFQYRPPDKKSANDTAAVLYLSILLVLAIFEIFIAAYSALISARQRMTSINIRRRKTETLSRSEGNPDLSPAQIELMSDTNKSQKSLKFSIK